jgi:hypothetical protein
MGATLMAFTATVVDFGKVDNLTLLHTIQEML